MLLGDCSVYAAARECGVPRSTAYHWVAVAAAELRRAHQGRLITLPTPGIAGGAGGDA